MKLEERIQRAIERNTAVADEGEDWAEVETRFVRAHRRRGVARTSLGAMAAVVLIAAGALASTRLGGEPSGLQNTEGTLSRLKNFAYVSTTSIAAMDRSSTSPDDDSIHASGTVDIRNSVRREIVKERWETVVSGERVHFTTPDERTEGWLYSEGSIADRVLIGGDDLFGLLSKPDGYLDTLRAVASDVRKVGEETIGGDETVRYVVTLDVERVLAATDDEDRSFVQIALSEPAARRVTAWVRSDGIAKRVRTVMKAGIGGEAVLVTRGYTLSAFDTASTRGVEIPRNNLKEVDSIVNVVATGGQTCTVTSSTTATVGGDGSTTGPSDEPTMRCS